MLGGPPGHPSSARADLLLTRRDPGLTLLLVLVLVLMLALADGPVLALPLVRSLALALSLVLFPFLLLVLAGFPVCPCGCPAGPALCHQRI